MIPVVAQDAPPIPPPAGYLDSCNSDPIAYDYFGPQCLNPVFWDMEGFPRIGTWVRFYRADGSFDEGLLVGFLWRWDKGHYQYYVMTQLPYQGFAGAFEDVDPDLVIREQ